MAVRPQGRGRRSLALVVVATGLAAAPVPALGASYAGGALTAAAPLVSARVGGDGSTLVLSAEAIARCGSGAAVDERAILRTGTAADGAFSASITRHYRLSPTERRSVRLGVTGRIAGTAASGGLRVIVIVRRTGRAAVRCDSGMQAWQARSVPAVVVPSGPPRAGARLFGATAQGGRYLSYPVVLGVSADGSRLSAAIFRVRRQCSGAASEDVSNNVTAVQLAADGSFATVQRYSQRFPDAVEYFAFTFTGRVTATGASGLLRVRSVLRHPRTRRLIGRCDSGTVGWSASA